MSKLTIKQQRFADEYIISGNATAAYKLAYSNVKKDSVANANGSRLLRNAKVFAYIEERLEELQSAKVADQQEIMEYLTSVLRGDLTEEQLLVVKDTECENVELHEKHPDIGARTKAAELLGKRYAMWTDKKQVDLTEQVVFVGEDNLED